MSFLSPPQASSAFLITPIFPQISAIYYHAGYPVDFVSLADYASVPLKSSRAAQCPSIALQLSAGAKKVQELLSPLGIIERCVAASEGANGQCRARYLGEHLVTLRRAHELVLKLQREEGGGNSLYRRSTPLFVA
jgi:hypothetical protein